ncbi:MAG: asparagine synthase (glutamine-hydrolyzing), partial [Candidatus Eisenbacteria bacterium]|nr:asparagine synthase (glutamine-hydrolyzing) [Candidatus Eisenbacteria bacterium]
MCGVCGVVTGNRVDDGVRARVEAMTRLLRHRGPDDTGVIGDARAVLGSNRLAIRGDDTGHQPLVDPETGVIVVCNGEIDNHQEIRDLLRERGRETIGSSDVSILPGLYLERGEDFVEELRGTFAVAVWDPRDGKLLLARDPAGERPLFYREAPGEVAFATELSALVSACSDARSLDPDALAGYLQFGCFQAPRSPFARIRKVAPAERICFWLPTSADRRVESIRKRFWRWPVGSVPKREADLNAFDPVFREAVRRQTACDVDFGLFLSGGVDSSLIAAVARSLHPGAKLPAFTLRFDQPSYDEGGAATEVASRFALVMHEVWVRAEHFPQRIRELVRLVGEPLADPAWVPVSLLAQRAAQEVKLVLGGEGGDEIFGGYPTYPGALLARGYERWPGFVRRMTAGFVRRWPDSDRKVTVSFLLKRFVDGAGMEPVARHLLWTSNLAPGLLQRLGIEPLPTEPTSPGEMLDVLQRHDLETTLAEGLLTKSDRAAMGWALESRAPFLDREVMEFAATLPPRERVDRLQTKPFLKRYALRYLPRAIVHRRKRGLSVPLSAWLRGPLE